MSVKVSSFLIHWTLSIHEVIQETPDGAHIFTDNLNGQIKKQ